MTMKAFTCDTFAEHLPAYLEGDASVEVRAAMEAHAAGCNACAGLLADIARLERDAAALPTLAPDRDLWDGIAKRIDAPVVPISSGVRRRPTAGAAGRGWWAHPLVAAAALVAVTAGVTHYLTRESLATGPSPSTAAVAPTVADDGATVEATPPLMVAARDAEAGSRALPPEAAPPARGGAVAGAAVEPHQHHHQRDGDPDGGDHQAGAQLHTASVARR
jgi:hypothetical protein